MSTPPTTPTFRKGQVLTADQLNQGFASQTPIPDNEPPAFITAFDGSELQSIEKNGSWFQITLANLASFILTIFTVVLAGGLSGVARTIIAMILDQPISVMNFGVKGDGTAADDVAMQKALTWWAGANERRLMINGGMTVRLSAPITADFSGIARAGKLLMYGSIQPDPGIGYAITFLNMRGGEVIGRVYGGGQTADYTQANPTGGDEALRFVNAYGTIIDAEAGNYAGRMVRVTKGTPGPDGFGSQWVIIKRLYTNSTAKITDLEATRLAQGVGQSIYVDTGGNAFGSIDKAFLVWEMYGPIWDNTTDVTIHDMETLWRGKTGMQCRQVISFWGKTLKLGSELSGTTMQLLSFVSSGGNHCQNVQLDDVFLVGGYDGMYAENVGVTSGQGLKIKNLVSRINTNTGLTLNNCRKFDVTTNQYGDNINLWLTGACSEGTVKFRSVSSKLQNIVIDAAVAGQIRFTGEASNGNTNAVAGTNLIDVNTVNPIYFDSMLASSGSVANLYGLVAGNATRLEGGTVVTGSGTAVYSTQPNRAHNVRGLLTQNMGQITIAQGQTQGFVPHGLGRAPDNFFPGPISQNGAGAWLTADATNIYANLGAAAPGALTVNWLAYLNFGI